MELKENEIRIYYSVKERILPFEKELIDLLENKGFEFWASGYGCGVRDLCFEKKIKK